MVELRKISILDENIKECIELDVTSEQRHFIAHNAISLGQAYAFNARYNESGNHAVPYSIYADGIMVGFIMYSFTKKGHVDNTYGEDCYYFWKFMIDAKQQGKGHGAKALTLLLDEIRQFPHGKAEYCYTSYERTNVVAKKLYESFGFVEVKNDEGCDIVLRLKL